MRLHIRPNGLMYNRIVVIPAKGFPNAVQRNLCRRHGKEAYRAQKEQLQCGYDLAIVCFPGEFSFAERLSQLSRLIEKADLTRA
jgi:ribonuclease P protein component